MEVGSKACEYMTDNFVVKEANGTLGWNKTVTVCSLNSTATHEGSSERFLMLLECELTSLVLRRADDIIQQSDRVFGIRASEFGD